MSQHEGYRHLPAQLREMATQGDQAPADSEKLEAYAGQVETLLSDLDQADAKAAAVTKSRAKDKRTLGMIEHLVDLSRE